jgi:sterol desaturase/sphingolipid hydroxylase (fatty acid hydroxylase superfamily)
MKNKILKWALFAFTFVFGIYFGGGLFEAVVIVPVWSASAEAARYWGSNPLSAVEGARFFLVAAPLSALLGLVTLVLGWNAPQPMRFWLRLGMGMFFAMFIATLGFYVPEQLAIKGPTMVRELSDAEIMSRAGRWVMLNYVRAVYGFGELFIILKAFSYSHLLKGE